MDIGICGVKETDVDDIDEESVDLEPSVGLITGTVDGKVVLKTDELEVICDGKEDELPDNERVDLSGWFNHCAKKGRCRNAEKFYRQQLQRTPPSML